MGTKKEILVELGQLVVQSLVENGLKGDIRLINNLMGSLLEPKVTPQMLNLTYSTIKHWESKGFLLLPPNKEIDEWRKFSILEYFWIQILKKFVTLGCSLDKVAPRLTFAFQNHRNPNETIAYQEIFTENTFLDTSFGFLTNIIFVYLQTGKTALHLFEDNCQFVAENGLDRVTAIKVANETMFKPGISICISDIVFEQSEKHKKRLMTPQIFSAEENEILSLFRKNELKEITIKLDNGKPVNIELTEKFDLKKEFLNKSLLGFLTSEYQEITAITNGGKPIHFERKTKLKINIKATEDLRPINVKPTY